MKGVKEKPKLDVSTIKLSNHAYRRATQRFKRTSKKDALSYFKGILKNATFIGKTTAEDGNESYLYANNNIAIYLSLDLTTIITVNILKDVSYKPIKEKLKDIHMSELKKLERAEMLARNRYIREKIEMNVELAQLEYRKLKTRSESVKLACQARINAINLYLQEYEDKVNELVAAKRQLFNSMVAVV